MPTSNKAFWGNVALIFISAIAGLELPAVLGFVPGSDAWLVTFVLIAIPPALWSLWYLLRHADAGRPAWKTARDLLWIPTCTILILVVIIWLIVQFLL
jgi:hypothetical protein